MINDGSLNSQNMIRIFKQSRHDFLGKHLCDGYWCLYVEMKIHGFVKLHLWICHVSLFECKGPWMLKTDSSIFSENIQFGANMVSKKMKIVCSIKVYRLEFVSLPFADQLQPNFYKLLCLEQNITKVDWKSTMYSAVKCPWIFIFILFCLIFC